MEFSSSNIKKVLMFLIFREIENPIAPKNFLKLYSPKKCNKTFLNFITQKQFNQTFLYS